MDWWIYYSIYLVRSFINFSSRQPFFRNKLLLSYPNYLSCFNLFSCTSKNCCWFNSSVWKNVKWIVHHLLERRYVWLINQTSSETFSSSILSLPLIKTTILLCIYQDNSARDIYWKVHLLEGDIEHFYRYIFAFTCLLSVFFPQLSNFLIAFFRY